MFRRRLAERAGSFVAPIRRGNEPSSPCCSKIYRMPAEDDEHEATWLQWPHNYAWDSQHVERYQDIFISATRALCTGEKVHIIVYNAAEQERIQQQLLANYQDKNCDNNSDKVDMSQIDFFQWPTDDVWIRDNGPIFVYEEATASQDPSQPAQSPPLPTTTTTRQLVVSDWRFNGWGNKADYWLSNSIPQHVARALQLPWLPVPMVNEGGSIEVDGRGTLLAKKSSIINNNRNPGWTQSDVERYFEHYLGIQKFIWLTGKKGGADITDDHVDGTARLAQHGNCIVAMGRDDLEVKRDYDILKNAKDVRGKPYTLVHLPLTAKSCHLPFRSMAFTLIFMWEIRLSFARHIMIPTTKRRHPFCNLYIRIAKSFPSTCWNCSRMVVSFIA
jgi:agmatine deiminase